MDHGAGRLGQLVDMPALPGVERFRRPGVPCWMSRADEPVFCDFTPVVSGHGRALEQLRGICLNSRHRALQRPGTTAKKCPVLASRSLDSEATAAFTTSKALPGCAKAHGPSPARCPGANGRTQDSVRGRGGVEPSIRAIAHPV